MSSIAARRANKRVCPLQPNGILSRGTHGILAQMSHSPPPILKGFGVADRISRIQPLAMPWVVERLIFCVGRHPPIVVAPVALLVHFLYQAIASSQLLGARPSRLRKSWVIHTRLVRVSRAVPLAYLRKSPIFSSAALAAHVSLAAPTMATRRSQEMVHTLCGLLISAQLYSFIRLPHAPDPHTWSATRVTSLLHISRRY